MSLRHGLSFDVEEAHHALNMWGATPHDTWDDQPTRVGAVVDRILALLAERDGLGGVSFEAVKEGIELCGKGGGMDRTRGGQDGAPGTEALRAGGADLPRGEGLEHAALAVEGHAVLFAGQDLTAVSRLSMEGIRVERELSPELPAVEDDEAASWIAGLIEGRAGDFGPVRARLLDCDGARRLRRLGQHDDLSVCVELDSRELVPVVVAGDPPRAVVVEPGAGRLRYNSPTSTGRGPGSWEE